MTANPNTLLPTQTISDPWQIDPDNLLSSLLSQAIQKGLLTEEERDKIRSCLFDLLAEVIPGVSGGSSTSVREETAKELLANILFHIESALKSKGNPESALSYLKSTPLARIYKDGMGMANRALDTACVIWQRLHTALHLDMDLAYKQFIASTLKEYLGNYNYQYEPLVPLDVKLPYLGIACTCHGIHEVLSFLRALDTHMA